MNAQEIVLSVMREQGRADAQSLRERANALDGTAVIAQEQAVPPFDATKDYTSWPPGAPVLDDGQVYKLIQLYNAADHPGTRPGDLPALWSICHTRDPACAKPYLPPNGTSGMYMSGECCTEGGKTYRSKIDNNVWPPSGYPDGWEEVSGGE